MKSRRYLLWIQAALCILLCILLSAGVIRLYMEGTAARGNGDLQVWIFTRENIGRLLLGLSPLFAAEAVLLVLTLTLRARGEMSEQSAAPSPSGSWPKPDAQGSASRGKWVRPVLLVLALGLVIHGALNGSMQDVFIKAVKICTECIGLG